MTILTKQPKGFTLVEVVIALAIFGMLIGDSLVFCLGGLMVSKV